MHSCDLLGMKMNFLRGEKGMMVKGITRTLLALFLVSPMWVYALGLGDIKLRSSLEEPFDAEIELTSASKSVLESLQVKLASSEDFSRVGIKPVAAVNLLSFEVVKKPDGSSAIHITTPEPVHDPYLNFLIEANWGRGRVLREYTVLLDPPELAGEETPVIEAPSVATVEPEIAAPPSLPDVLEPPPVAAEIIEPELPSDTRTAVAEPELLPPVDDEGLIEPEIIEPEPLPDVAEPELLEPEILTPVDGEGLIESEPLLEVVEPEPVEPELDENAELPIAETEPLPVPEAQDAFPDAGEVAIGSETVAPLTYSVGRGDTLWSIAEEMRGERPVTVYQVMMALFQNNPSAFIDNNMNNLKMGSILRVEDESEFSAVDTVVAKTEFWQQYRAWQSYKQMLAENIATQGEESAPAEETFGAGEDVAKLAESSTPVDGGAQLTLVSPDEVDTAAPAGETAGKAVDAGDAPKGMDELQAMRDEVLAEIEKSEAGSEQNLALREKLAALEEQIASLQRVVSVKDTELAALQQKVAEDAAPLSDDAAGAEVAEEGLMAKLNRSPQLMGITGGVLLLLLAWLWLTFRRRSEENRAMATLVAAEEGTTALPDDEVFQDEGDSDRKILSQVDAYVNAGKHAAAAEMLTEAIQREPDNEVYRYRLLEIHYEMKNRDGFLREAEDLYGLTQGKDSARWGKVAAMGAALLPAHALFSSEPDFAEEGTGFDREFSAESDTGLADEGVAPDGWDELDSELDDSSLKKDDEAGQLIDEVLSGRGEETPEEVDQAGGEVASGEAWDSGFDMEEADRTSETFLMEEEILDDSSSKLDSGDGIDFNLSEDVGSREATGSIAEAPESGEVLAFARRDEEAGAVAGETEVPAYSSEEPLFDVETADQNLLVDDSDVEIMVGDGDDLLEFDSESESSEQPFPSFSEYDAMAEDDDLLDDIDEIGTKLDLAKAYIDMGDAEAARNILDEVKDEGDHVQKQEAAELLGQISGAGGR